jgi:CRP-like cAMP-binding protein
MKVALNCSSLEAVDSGPEEQALAGDGSPDALAANPELTDEQLARLHGYSTPDALDIGESAFAAGDPSYDLIVIDEGAIDVVRPATANAPEAALIRFGPGGFVAELSIVTGQTAYLTASVVESQPRSARARAPSARSTARSGLHIARPRHDGARAREEPPAHGPVQSS